MNRRCPLQGGGEGDQDAEARRRRGGGGGGGRRPKVGVARLIWRSFLAQFLDSTNEAVYLDLRRLFIERTAGGGPARKLNSLD